jgi:hypothetical protein
MPVERAGKGYLAGDMPFAHRVFRCWADALIGSPLNLSGRILRERALDPVVATDFADCVLSHKGWQRKSSG